MPPPAGPELVRGDLVDEAMRLARLLRRLLPGRPGAAGLLALMLLQDSRRPTRVDAAGAAVLLADQDRSPWDRAADRRGGALVGEGLRLSPATPDPYVVQAAIAACHALAPSWEETDWAAIESWYEVLLRVDDGPVVRLNHAVAVAEGRGAAAGARPRRRDRGAARVPALARDPGRAVASARPGRRGRRGRRPRAPPAAQRGPARPARPLSVGAPAQDIVVRWDNSLLEYA